MSYWSDLASAVSVYLAPDQADTADDRQSVNNGVLTGGSYAGGSFGRAIDLAADSLHGLDVGDDDTLDLQGDLFLAVRVTPDSISGAANRGLISKYVGAGNQRSFLLYQHDNGSVGFAFSTNGTFQAANTVESAQGFLVAGQTSSVAVRRTATSGLIELFVDGAVVASTTKATSPIYSSTAPLSLGWQFDKSNGSNHFAGLLSEAVIATSGDPAEHAAGPEPINTSAPAVSFDGNTLSYTTGSWETYDNGTITYAVSIRRNGVEIATDTGAGTYNASSDGAGEYDVVVTASNNGGSHLPAVSNTVTLAYGAQIVTDLNGDIVTDANGRPVTSGMSYDDVVAGADHAYLTPSAGDDPSDQAGSLDLTWVGTAAYTDGLYGRVALFDGTNRLTSGSPVLPGGASERTIFVRYKRTSGTGHVFGQSGPLNGEAFRFRAANPTSGQGLIGAPRVEFEGSYQIADFVDDLTWRSIALVVPAGATTTDDVGVRIDGAQISLSGSSAQPIVSATANLVLGDDDIRPEPFAGLVGEVCTYGSALSAAAITSLHAGPPPTVTASNLTFTGSTANFASTITDPNNGSITTTYLLQDADTLETIYEGTATSYGMTGEPDGNYRLWAIAENDGGVGVPAVGSTVAYTPGVGRNRLITDLRRDLRTLLTA